jgi:hypothetical protein
MDTTEYRIERDSMGEVRVPKSAYYGAQTQRACLPIGRIQDAAKGLQELALGSTRGHRHQYPSAICCASNQNGLRRDWPFLFARQESL